MEYKYRSEVDDQWHHRTSQRWRRDVRRIRKVEWGVSNILPEMSIKEVVDTIINDVAYTVDEEQYDDITLVVVRVS